MYSIYDIFNFIKYCFIIMFDNQVQGPSGSSNGVRQYSNTAAGYS